MGNDIAPPEITHDSQEYFDLIDRKISNGTRNATTQSKTNTLTPTKQWLTSLLKYTNAQYTLGITWYKEYEDILHITSFASENKYLDFFFWQKFEMITKPRCLTHLPQSSSSSLQSTSSSDVSLSEYQLNKTKIHEYINIFQNHLQNQDHPITMCIDMFVKIFCREINFHITQLKAIENNDTNDDKHQQAQLVCEAIIDQLTSFIVKIQKCFGYMYSKVLAYKFYKQEKDVFITLFTSEFFVNQTLYKSIMELIMITLEPELNAFKQRLHTLNENNIQVGDLGINIKYRLDKYTLKAQVDFLLQKNITLSDDKLIYLNTYHTKDGYVPYQSAIEILKTIGEYQTPFDKVNLIASISQDVIKSVTNAWSAMEEYLPKDYLSIDGDELILIFAFIVIKTQMHELLAHLWFIKNFITQDTKTSMIGYYYTTLEASVIMIKEMEVKNKNENEKKISSD